MYPPLSPRRTVHGSRPSLVSRRRAGVRLDTGVPVTAPGRPPLSAGDPARGPGSLAAPVELSFNDWMDGEGLPAS